MGSTVVLIVGAVSADVLLVGAVIAEEPPPPLLLHPDSKTSPTSAIIAFRQPRRDRMVLMFITFPSMM